MEWVLLLVIFLLGSANGYAIQYINESRKPKEQPSGTLKVVTGDPDGPYIFAEFTKDVSTIITKKRIILDVDMTFISHD